MEAGASLLERDVILLDDGTWRPKSPERQEESGRSFSTNAGARTTVSGRDINVHADTSHATQAARSPQIIDFERPTSRYFAGGAPRAESSRSFFLPNAYIDDAHSTQTTRNAGQSMGELSDHAHSVLNNANTRPNRELRQPGAVSRPAYRGADYTDQQYWSRASMPATNFFPRQAPEASHFDDFRYVDQRQPHQPHRAIPAPLTPSPKKHFAMQESASSPFFDGGPRTALQHTGRLSLPHRTGSAAISTPRRPPQEPYFAHRPNFFAAQIPNSSTPSPATTSTRATRLSGPTKLATEARRSGNGADQSRNFNRMAARR